MGNEPFISAAINLWNGMLDILYPPYCLICETSGEHFLCKGCRARFQENTVPFCARCGHPLHEPDCTPCRLAGIDNWGFDIARSAALYDDTLAEAIQKFKYQGKEVLGEPLGEYLALRLINGNLFLPEQLSEIAVVVPIPLHRRRIRHRGFNQSAILAMPVAKALQVPLKRDGLKRAISTRQQARLSGTERRANMHEGVFVVSDKAAVQGKTVLLVDDVMTTGTTLSAAAKALKAGGAKSVFALTLAVGA